MQLYGGAVANLLLSALGRLFTSFLQLHGFTLGVEDILVLAGADEERRKAMEECKQCGSEAAAEAFNITDPHNTGKSSYNVVEETGPWNHCISFSIGCHTVIIGFSLRPYTDRHPQCSHNYSSLNHTQN